MTADSMPLLARYRSAAPELPKHVRVRNVFVDAITAGELRVGAQVLPERELSRLLGLSLGTMQKGLNRLTAEGFLVRRHGHGTFVGSQRQPMAGTWHARFVAEDGVTELPVFATLLDRRLVHEEGPWSDLLGHDPKGYVLIMRAFDVGGRFVCASRLYLGATRFARLLRMAGHRLSDVNLKVVLNDTFAAPTLHSQGLAKVVALGAEDAARMAVAPNTVGLQVDINAYSFGRTPIAFQRMLVPPTPCAMKLDFNPPESAAAVPAR